MEGQEQISSTKQVKESQRMLVMDSFDQLSANQPSQESESSQNSPYILVEKSQNDLPEDEGTKQFSCQESSLQNHRTSLGIMIKDIRTKKKFNEKLIVDEKFIDIYRYVGYNRKFKNSVVNLPVIQSWTAYIKLAQQLRKIINNRISSLKYRDLNKDLLKETKILQKAYEMEIQKKDAYILELENKLKLRSGCTNCSSNEDKILMLAQENDSYSDGGSKETSPISN